MLLLRSHVVTNRPLNNFVSRLLVLVRRPRSVRSAMASACGNPGRHHVPWSRGICRGIPMCRFQLDVRRSAGMAAVVPDHVRVGATRTSTRTPATVNKQSLTMHHPTQFRSLRSGTIFVNCIYGWLIYWLGLNGTFSIIKLYRAIKNNCSLVERLILVRWFKYYVTENAIFNQWKPGVGRARRGNKLWDTQTTNWTKPTNHTENYPGSVAPYDTWPENKVQATFY